MELDLISVGLAVASILFGAGAAILLARRGRRRQQADPKAASFNVASLGRKVASIFRRGVGDDGWQELEDILVLADLGMKDARLVVEAAKATNPADESEVMTAVTAELGELFAGRDRDLSLESSPSIIVMVGINGVGKTTTIAKLAHLLQSEGKTVLLAAADTFRAGAASQLRTWAERLNAGFVGGQDGGDPAAVAFDAYSAGRARGADVVIVDTAGRLHSKSNLMDELRKVVRVLEREAGVVDEILLVVDATVGQNGLAQAKEFGEAVGLTGLVLSKLDGTARGGIVVRIERELGAPVKFVGVGETATDLLPFDPDAFVAALMETA